MHVFLKRALVTEGIVACRRLLVKEAVKAFCGAVAWDGGVVLTAVGRVVLGLGVSGLSTYPATFVGVGTRACVCVIGE